MDVRLSFAKIDKWEGNVETVVRENIMYVCFSLFFRGIPRVLFPIVLPLYDDFWKGNRDEGYNVYRYGLGAVACFYGFMLG